MLELAIPLSLKEEFATIEALWCSSAETRRVDSLLLAWVKYEKQLWRLFCFLVYQHPMVTAATINSVIGVLVANDKLYPDTFTRGIKALGVASIPKLVGAKHGPLESDIRRIKKYRNKLMHGQATGQSIQATQLESDVKRLIEWVGALAAGADAEFGYDGLRRKTFQQAKTNAKIAVAEFPFSTNSTFSAWLKEL